MYEVLGDLPLRFQEKQRCVRGNKEKYSEIQIVLLFDHLIRLPCD